MSLIGHNLHYSIVLFNGAKSHKFDNPPAALQEPTANSLISHKGNIQYVFSYSLR